MKNDNKCKNMLRTCKAFCCRAVAFSVPKGKLSPDYRKYLEIHNVLIKSYENTDIIIIPIRCKYLDENLECMVYGTSKQPMRCLDSSSISRDMFYVPGCRFITRDKPYVLTETDLEKLFGK